MENSSSPIGIILVFVVVAIMAGVTVLMIRSSIRARKRRQEEAAALGFTEVPKTEYAYIKQHLADTNPRFGKSHIDLRNVFSRQLPEGRLILYDLWDTGSDSNDQIQDRSLMLIVEEMNLPKFMISAKNPILTNSPMMPILTKALSFLSDRQGLQPVTFTEYPEYDHKVLAASDNPSFLQEKLDGNTLGRLAMYDDLFLGGGKSSLVYTPLKTVNVQKPEPANLSNRINKALSIMRIFLDCVR